MSLLGFKSKCDEELTAYTFDMLDDISIPVSSVELLFFLPGPIVSLFADIDDWIRDLHLLPDGDDEKDLGGISSAFDDLR